jgi:hypothetical protein
MGWGMKGKCGGGVQNKDAFVYILGMGIARFDHLPSASRIYPELKSLSPRVAILQHLHVFFGNGERTNETSAS